MRTIMLLTLSTALALGVAEARAGDAKAGEKKYQQNCVTCHGKAGKGMASFPSIAGRDKVYISDRLMKYRAKEKVGPNTAIMLSWAENLSDQDIANLAEYISATFR
jgi:cytochrome c553